MKSQMAGTAETKEALYVCLDSLDIDKRSKLCFYSLIAVLLTPQNGAEVARTMQGWTLITAAIPISRAQSSLMVSQNLTSMMF